jgi:hypothetical protein
MSVQKKQTTEQRLRVLENVVSQIWNRLAVYDKEIFELMPKKRQKEIEQRNKE